jgi:hypothetical protein
MYVLVLVGYVIAGGSRVAGPSVAAPLIVGHFDSAKSCYDTVNGFDKSKASKDTDLREYRWGLLCLPAGSETKD